MLLPFALFAQKLKLSALSLVLSLSTSSPVRFVPENILKTTSWLLFGKESGVWPFIKRQTYIWSFVIFFQTFVGFSSHHRVVCNVLLGESIFKNCISNVQNVQMPCRCMPHRSFKMVATRKYRNSLFTLWLPFSFVSVFVNALFGFWHYQIFEELELEL